MGTLHELAQTFFAVCAATPPVGTDLEEVGAALEQLFVSGERTHPRVRLASLDLARHVGERHAARPLSLERLKRLDGAGLYLAAACLAKDSAAMNTLEALVQEALPWVKRVDPTAAFVDDVRQQLLETLLTPARAARSKIAEYTGVGSLRSWIRAVALGTAVSLRRRQGGLVLPGDEALSSLTERAEGGEVDYLRARYRESFNDAFQDALRTLDPSERNLLRLHYLMGLTLEELGRLHGYHRSTSVRWLARARHKLLAQTRALLRQRLGLTRSEVSSLVRLLRSELDVSLRAFWVDPA